MIALGGTVEVSASITVDDPDVYARIVGLSKAPAATITVTRTVDLNPHHRWAPTFRAFLRQCRDILVWEYRAAARVAQVSEQTVTVTMPAVNFSAVRL